MKRTVGRVADLLALLSACACGPGGSEGDDAGRDASEGMDAETVVDGDAGEGVGEAEDGAEGDDDVPPGTCAWRQPAASASGPMMDVWATTPSDIFVVGRIEAAGPLVQYYDGDRWWRPLIAGAGSLLGVWGWSSSNVLAVGEDEGAPVVLRINGPTTTTRLTPPPSGTLQDVWGPSPSDVFVVGYLADGLIYRFDGTTWESMAPGTTAWLRAVWGSAANDVYAVGTEGTTGAIVHYDGTAWTAVDTGTGALPFLQGVGGTAADDVFVVGVGTVLHYDGAVWQTTPLPAGSGGYDLQDVWGSSSMDVYVVGYDIAASSAGVILHYDGTDWTTMDADGARWLQAIHFAVGSHSGTTSYDVFLELVCSP
jgi:hypothetical protein